MPVNTKLLAVGQANAPGWRTVYTVPAGHTSIVKHWIFCSYIAGPHTIELACQVASGGLYMLERLVVEMLVPTPRSPWIVLPAGYQLRVNGVEAAQSFSYWVSGTELTGQPDNPTIPTGLSPGQRPS